jgi:heme O synthase-like polyprenyltransferase
MFNQIWTSFVNTFFNQKVAKFTLLTLYSLLMVISFSSQSAISQLVGLLCIACGAFVFSFIYFEEMDMKHAVTTLIGAFIPFVIGMGCYFMATRSKEAGGNVELAALFALSVSHFFWLSSIVFFDSNRRLIIQKLNNLFNKSE